MPVLEDGELMLFESAPICRYLAEQYGAGQLLPQSVAERAQVDQWLSFIVTEIEQPLWLQAKHKFALPQDKRVPSVLPTAAWEFQRALLALERRYRGQENLVGDTFTLADLFLTHTLTWATSMKHRLPEPLVAYRARHANRPALARAAEKSRRQRKIERYPLRSISTSLAWVKSSSAIIWPSLPALVERYCSLCGFKPVVMG